MTVGGYTDFELSPPFNALSGNQYRPESSPEQLAEIAPFSPSDLPDDAVITSDNAVLFKQTQELFKQIRNEHGRLIGLIYRGPRTTGETTLNFAQVKARRNIYIGRSNRGEVSQAVAAGLEVWEWAFSLFEESKKEVPA